MLALYAKAGAVARTRPVSDFYVAGRLVPGLLNGMAIAICLLPVLAFAGLAGPLSQGWDGASLLVLGGVGGLLLISLFIAPYLRKFGGYTVPDFLGERFGGTGVRPLAVLAVILCSFPALALALMGLSVIVMRLFAVEAWIGMAIAVAMLFLCSFAAGMRSASLTQISPIRRVSCRCLVHARDRGLAARRAVARARPGSARPGLVGTASLRLSPRRMPPTALPCCFVWRRGSRRCRRF